MVGISVGMIVGMIVCQKPDLQITNSYSHLISMVGTLRSGDSESVTKGEIVFLCLGYNRNTISVTAFLCSKIVILCWTQKATLKVLTKDKKKCTHLQQHCIYQGGNLWAKGVPILRIMCQLRSFNILQCE